MHLNIRIFRLRTVLRHNGNLRLGGLHAHGKFLARLEIIDIDLSVTGEQERFVIPARVPFSIVVICINNFGQIATGIFIMRGTYDGRFRRWPTAAPLSLDRADCSSNQVLHNGIEKKSAHKGKIVTDEASFDAGSTARIIAGVKPVDGENGMFSPTMMPSASMRQH